MSSFTKHPPLIPHEDGITWEVAEDFEYHVGLEDSNEVIKIPKGYLSDLASIPKPFWSLIGGPWGRYGYAAILHDYILQEKLYPAKRADQIFLEAMTVLKVPKWKRIVMYSALRVWHMFSKQLWN